MFNGFGYIVYTYTRIFAHVLSIPTNFIPTFFVSAMLT